MDKYKDADLLKLFFLSAHYSHPIDYNSEKIEEAKQALERISILMGKIEKLKDKKSGSKSIKDSEAIKNSFIGAMDDDFNMPEGLACIFDLVSTTNKNIDDTEFVATARDLLSELTGIFGLDLKKISGSNLPASVTVFNIEELIEKRNKARKNGDFKEADSIRKELEDNGIILEDTKEGTIWRRKL
jgi:cysteinyl-tRNA synthetase